MATSPRQQSKSSNKKVRDPEGLAINRDHTFVRISADETIAVRRDDEFHISFLEFGRDPVFRGIATETGPSVKTQPIRLSPSLTEVARVRLPAQEAFSMAMVIIERALAAGRVKTSVFKDSIDSMLQDYQHLDTDDEGSVK